jgi:hypothetical protein
MPATSRNTPQRHTGANHDQLKLSGIDCPDDRAINALAQLISNDENLTAAVNALAELADNRCIPSLIKALSHRDAGWFRHPVHKTALAALANFDDQNAIEAIIDYYANVSYYPAEDVLNIVARRREHNYSLNPIDSWVK